VPHHPPRQEPEPERAPWWKVRWPTLGWTDTHTSLPHSPFPMRQLASWFGSVDSEAAAATSPSSDSNAVKGVYMYGDVGTVCCLNSRASLFCVLTRLAAGWGSMYQRLRKDIFDGHVLRGCARAQEAPCAL
jgi:hypothetical protein